MRGRPSTNQYKIKYIVEQNSGKTLAHLGLIPGSHMSGCTEQMRRAGSQTQETF